MNRRSTVLFAVAAALTTACGGSSFEPQTGANLPAGQTVVVVTSPAETDLQPGDSVRFAAQVTGTANTSVKWSVDEASGGTVDSAGTYTAPAAEGTYHVRAESVVGSSSATASVKGGGASVVRVRKGTAPQPVTVAVDPATVTVPAGGSVTFAAAVAGSTNRSVSWTVSEGASCGTVTSGGVYTAPGAGATCHVVATSQADTSKSASATVTVSAPPTAAVAISISPATATLDACRGQVFTPTVTNASNTTVTWTVVEAGGGTVTSGAYVAPSSPGTYHVMAVSQADPTKTAQATVTVGAERVLSVAMNPGGGTVQANGQIPFSATVTTTCGTFAAQ